MHRYPLIAVLIPLILFILVVDASYQREAPVYPKETTSYLVEVLANPVRRPKTWRMPVALLAYKQRDSIQVRLSSDAMNQAMIYLMVDSGVPLPRCSDRLWLTTRMVSISDSTANLPAYYQQYLYHNGYPFTAVVYPDKWTLFSPGILPDLYRSTPLRRRISAHFEYQRQRLLSYYHTLFRPVDTQRAVFPTIPLSDRFSLLESLSIGQRQHLSEKVKHDFSASGISHLLALSGFHLVILLFPFFWWQKLDRRLGTRIVQALLIVLTMTYFTYLSGAPISLCRASLLLASCYILSLFSTQISILNNLFLVAIVMLIAHPFWLFDVGFQLSFTAVLSIRIFHPLLRITIPGKNAIADPMPRWQKPLIRYLWDPLSVALAAQIGTFPLVVYHFNQFALYAIFASVVMIPIITPILYLAWGMPLVHLAITQLGQIVSHDFSSFSKLLDHLLAPFLSTLLGAMLYVAQTVNQLPSASIHFRDLQWFELTINYGIVCCIYQLLKTKKHLFYSMLLLILIFLLLILSRF